MELVLLSGGSGKRLWPLSNDSRSKQFLKVLQDGELNKESMVQRVWRQINAVGLSSFTTVATGVIQVDMIHNQLGMDVPLVIEPERRDTFAAIALASVYLYSIKGISLDQTICILPVDAYVENRFFQKVKELDKAIKVSGADLALIGVQPTYPSSKYGYIIPKEEVDNNSSFLPVSHFTEKPSEEKAEELIKLGALWNCGVFAFKLDYIIKLLIERQLPIQYDELLIQYNKLPKKSFDYEVVEKAQHVVVTPYDGYWKDLGTWNTLTEEMAASILGNGLISKDSMNTHVVNELDIPVAVLGLSNVVVAASPDGILVTDKSSSPRIKELVEQFHQMPMYEERRWGWYRVLDFTKNEFNEEVVIRRVCIYAGKNLSYHFHRQRIETWSIINGEGEVVINGKIERVQAGDFIKVPVGVKHSIKAITNLEVIEIETGALLAGNDDISRIFFDWNDIEGICVNV